MLPVRPCVSGFVADALVIGYGNDLRSDDGAGRWVADQIERRELAGIDVRSVPQLTPELALDIAGRPTVVFVDASVDVESLSIDRVADLDGTPGVMTHHGSPASVLSLVDRIGERPELAIVVSLPASNLEMGFELSPPTLAAAQEALDRIVEIALGSGAGS